MGVLLVWTATGLAITLVRSQSWFWALGAILGFIFGGVRTTERPLLLTLVPDVQAGRYFGLLVLSARAAAIAGPLIWALVVDVIFRERGPESSYRLAMGSLTLFMAVAAWLLIKVPGAPKPEGPFLPTALSALTASGHHEPPGHHRHRRPLGLSALGHCLKGPLVSASAAWPP